MCGISGIVDKSNSVIQKEKISGINNAAHYRGPDAESYFFKDNFALGHRRLSIIDLSHSSDQPMTIAGLTIVYNGEIFNYVEIRNRLKETGYQFLTESDTEVIILAYKEWGSNCVDYFNGMWAFCIYDEKEGTFFCSRDRFGIKPFYFLNSAKYFAFGSEIKQLLGLLEEKKANRKALAEFIIGIEDYSTETFFEEIFRLLPGHNLKFCLEKKSLDVWRYYEIKKVKVPDNFVSSLREYKDLFQSSVEMRLRADVKVGTCLSGGLDSSAITSIAAKTYFESRGERLLSVHAKSFEKETDESYFASLVAKRSNLDFFVTEPDKASFKEVLSKVIEIQGEPFGGPSIVMQYFVFEEAAKQNIKVMLDGQGGDESLIGYDSYFNMYLSTIPYIRNIMNFIFPDRITQFRINLKFAFLFRRINSKIKKRLHKRKFSFLKDDYFKKIDYSLIVDTALKHCKNDFLFQKFEMQYGIQKLLRYEDRNSMFHGVESRLPFLDHRLLEYSLSLPLRFKLKQSETKHILRKSMEGNVSDEIVYRVDKKGFEAPSSFWNQFVDENKESIKGSKIVKDMICNDLPTDRQLLWRFASIAAWEKVFNVKL